MTAGVYGIQNTQDDMVYVGSSLDIAVRLRQHLSTLRRGTSPCKGLQAAWNIAGESAFRFVTLEQIGADSSDLVVAEQRWLDHFDGQTYNVNSRAIRARSPIALMERFSVSMPPSLIETLDKLREYAGQDRSEVVRRLVVEEAKRREQVGAST